MAGDWVSWHDTYDDPASPLRMRLTLVTEHLSAAVAAAPDGPVQVVSLCAGQGRDIIGALAGHPRQGDVAALLVELDPANAKIASDRATAAGLTSVTVRQADAGIVAHYADALLLCGIFGNLDDEDIQQTVAASAAMCAPGGTVIWTRHRRPPDLTVQIRSWFATAGFEEVAFEAPHTTMSSVGVHRRRDGGPSELAHGAGPIAAAGLPPGGRLFTFRPDRQAGPSPAPG